MFFYEMVIYADTLVCDDLQHACQEISSHSRNKRVVIGPKFSYGRFIWEPRRSEVIRPKARQNLVNNCYTWSRAIFNGPL